MLCVLKRTVGWSTHSDEAETMELHPTGESKWCANGGCWVDVQLGLRRRCSDQHVSCGERAPCTSAAQGGQRGCRTGGGGALGDGVRVSFLYSGGS